MSKKKSLKHNLDADSFSKPKMGRPFGTTRVPKSAQSHNIPFTQVEVEKLEELINMKGMNKRHWIKKFISEGLEKELEKR